MGTFASMTIPFTQHTPVQNTVAQWAHMHGCIDMVFPKLGMHPQLTKHIIAVYKHNIFLRVICVLLLHANRCLNWKNCIEYGKVLIVN